MFSSQFHDWVIDSAKLSFCNMQLHMRVHEIIPFSFTISIFYSLFVHVLGHWGQSKKRAADERVLVGKRKGHPLTKWLRANSRRKSTMQLQFYKISTIFEPNLNLWKTDILTLLKKSISQSFPSSPSLTILISWWVLMISRVLLYKIKPLLFDQLPKIDICFWDFQSHFKNVESVPSRLRVLKSVRQFNN